MSNAFTQCRDLAQPLPHDSPALINSAAMSSVLKQMGIQACRTAEVAAGPWVPVIQTVAASVSVGCEQVAVMAAAIDQTQRAIQCTVSNISQSSSTSVIAANNVILNISGHAQVACVVVDQNINLKIGTSVEFSNQVKSSMASDLSATMKNLANAVQDASKDVLATPQGQKTATLFATYLEQTAFQGSFDQIITDSIQNFQATNTFTLNLTDYAFIGLLAPNPNQLTNGCLNVNQNIVMQVISSTIMDNCLAHVFSADIASEWVNEWTVAQKSQATGYKFPFDLSFAIIGPIIIIIIIIIVIVMLVKGGGANSMMSAPGGTPGQRGTMIAGIFVAISIILFFVGVGLLAAGISVLGGAICLVMGLIGAALGGYLLWRAQKLSKTSTTTTTTTQG